MAGAGEIIAQLGLQPHPEGGHFRETFRDAAVNHDGRSVVTAIFYLLEAGEVSHWHRVDASEIWHFYDGAPLQLSICEQQGAPVSVYMLGAALGDGQLPQAVVPAGYWQSAKSSGDWSLVGCTVAPGFEFEGFELAPSGWKP